MGTSLPVGRQLAYRSGTDYGNPSFADWDWSVTADPRGGCTVNVTFQARPRTFWRSLVLARIRQYQLARGGPWLAASALDRGTRARPVT